MRILFRVLLCTSVFGHLTVEPVKADTIQCINIYHDESGSQPSDTAGPINAIMLANVLGHWPQYELRAKPIFNYRSDELEECKATIYLGTGPDTDIPKTFLDDFFKTEKRVAWVGFGQQKLDKRLFADTFKHVVKGQLDVDTDGAKEPQFYQYVSYKDRIFSKSVELVDGKAEGAFEAVEFVAIDKSSKDYVVANLVHNTNRKTSPYFLRAGTKFVVGDVPFSYMHEGDRYFAFSDFLFDVLDEKPIREKALAFARTEDIHGNYETYLLKAVLAAHKSENVPLSIAHIPLFMDPLNAFGGGEVKEPKAANTQADFMAFVREMQSDPQNAIIWHGVTHQFGETKNPHSGTSGDDYEFWNMTANKPSGDDTVQWTLDRLSKATPIFSAYGQAPRFWVTPHYHASAVNSRVLANVVPWNIGRVTYYPSSFGPSFTLSPADKAASLAMPSITAEVLESKKNIQLPDLDQRSEGGLTQMFPFEIYRDVYGQRIVPETLGYLSYATSEQTAFVRTVDNMLADARRNSVIRDYWASFFYHPYIFASTDDGGVGRFGGDTLELRKLLIGLKLLGYSFTSLSDFEASLTKVGKIGAISSDPVTHQ